MLPACWKCRKKQIHCPGYKQSANIRWSMPLTTQDLVDGNSRWSTTSPAKQLESEPRRSQSKELILGSAAQKPDDVVGVNTATSTSATSSGLNFLSTSLCSEAVIISPGARRLLDYYCNALSAKLPWVDHTDNPWRTVIVPAALRSSYLLNTILTMVSEDFAWTLSGHTSATVYRREAEKYHTRALRLLSLQLASDGARKNPRTLCSEETIHVLATVLLLCNLEMRKPESNTWRVHLKAAQTLTQSCFSTDVGSASGMARFLMLKCASLSVFACMSNFMDGEYGWLDYISASDNSEFIPFLRVLKAIALKNREHRSASTLPRDSPAFCRADCGTLREDLMQAQRKTSDWISSMAYISASMQHDLEQVGNMFRLAGLIYGHQALQLSCCSQECELSGLQIMDNCRAFHQLPLFSQNVLWPLFIAGTMFRGRIELQKRLEAEIHGVARLSGHRNVLSALKFLTCFWGCQPGNGDSWIDFAVDWTEQRSEFIVI